MSGAKVLIILNALIAHAKGSYCIGVHTKKFGILSGFIEQRISFRIQNSKRYSSNITGAKALS